LMPGGFEPVLDTPSEPETDEEAEKKPAANSADKNATVPIAGLSGGRSNWSIEYADVREDRVVFYGTVTSNLSEITYRIKATNKGKFVVPPAYAEALYERSVQARSLGGQSLVVEGVKGK
ncbi:MAG: hypothetical protein V4805_15930, partial [Pseudomonadota bacterium]